MFHVLRAILFLLTLATSSFAVTEIRTIPTTAGRYDELSGHDAGKCGTT